MDRLSELGTARGFAEQRVARAEAELAEAKRDLGRCIGEYIDYVKLNPPPDTGPTDDEPVTAAPENWGGACPNCGATEHLQWTANAVKCFQCGVITEFCPHCGVDTPGSCDTTCVDAG